MLGKNSQIGKRISVLESVESTAMKSSDWQIREYPQPGWGTFALMTILVLTAFLYYGQYYNKNFNFADEGNIALISQRILEGEIPLKDIEFGAGPIWPYSIVLLFGVFGVDFIAMKVYFFSLATATALLGFATVTRYTSRHWLGFLAGLLLILIPGVIERIFIPLAIVSNMYMLSRIDIDKPTLALGQLVPAAMVIALTFLLRGDLGLWAATVFICLITYYIVSRGRAFPDTLSINIRNIGFAVISFVMVLMPFFIMSFLNGTMGLLTKSLFGRFEILFSVLQTRSMIPTLETSQTGDLNNAGLLLERLSMESMLKTGLVKLWAILTYLPLFIFALTVLAFLMTFFLRIFRESVICVRKDVPLLVLFGLAFGVFPQFFLWRPDVDHLSGFMPGYIIFGLVLIHRCLPFPFDVSKQDIGFTRNTILYLRNIFKFFLAFLVTLNIGMYAWAGMQTPSTGSIARMKGQTELFEAENGVRVYVSPQKYAGLTRMKFLIEKYADPKDYLLSFPYAPGFNFMTNRKTFMRRIYADDSRLITDPVWQANTVKKIESLKPAVIVIGNWAINSTEISRFPNWATQVTEYVYHNYESVDTVLDHTVYVHRDRFM